MKRIMLLLSLLVAVLSACGTSPAPVETPVLLLPSATQPANPVADTPVPTVAGATPSPKLPAAPFESEVYLNEEVGFALDYPAGWTVNEMVVGERGTQIQFLSSPEVADMPVVPADATRLNATIYQWDPKNDLDAYIANWKTSWDASGFTVLEEQELVLEQGLPAVQYTIQTPDADIVFLVTAIGDRYLVFSGEGNLELVKQIVQRVRPISR